ncbi:uncharacterized protein LOC113759889 [Coffea eugenioides]|uniref:uncharacterized protein LOC113759889 n=1 Tax=Coffea eugenioides TaxID=49369 RepID=UPI000F6069EE|nr:uncharacterized protein LOC113759889 [Coffea eugenioides]
MAPVLALPNGKDSFTVYTDALREGLGNRIVVPEDENLMREILDEAHRSKYTIHPGSTKMYQDLRRLYWWDKMKREIAQYVQTYLVCQQLARVYMEEIVRLHGVPVSIVSDRDPRFVSRFWQKFQETLGTKLNLSTTYHPQTDEQSEQMIQTLEDMLRTCVLDFGGSWGQHMTLVEFAYNNSYHSSIQMAPYEALYGRKCRSPLYWDEVGEKKVLDPTVIPWMEDAQEKKYYPDPTHIVQSEEIEIDESLTYEEKPVRLLDRKVKELRSKQISLVKILWKNHGVEEATWEMEEDMKKKYHELFVNQGEKFRG